MNVKYNLLTELGVYSGVLHFYIHIWSVCISIYYITISNYFQKFFICYIYNSYIYIII